MFLYYCDVSSAGGCFFNFSHLFWHFYNPKRAFQSTLGKIKSKNVITCDTNVSVSELMETMTINKIRHMVIMEQEKLLGMVSIGDVVNHIIEQYKEENEKLRNYINN